MTNDIAPRIHKAITVEVGSWREEIDEAIAPLIHAIWLAGIETVMSCQGNGRGPVWIAFPDEANLVAFLNCVAEYEGGVDTLYNRMNPRWTGKTSLKPWEYEIYPVDAAFYEEDSDDDGDSPERHLDPPDFFFFYSVRFPRGDLPVVLERMKRHNRGINVG
jgi:hypothetical protein